jgi:hypothetical protein
VNRKTRGLSETGGVELPEAGGVIRVDGPAVSERPDGWLGRDRISLRRVDKRSDSDLSERPLPGAMLGGVAGRSMRGLSTAGGAGLAALSVPSRLRRPSIPLEPPASDGCGSDLRENRLDRSEPRLDPMLGPGILRCGVGALGVKRGV